MIGIPGEIYGQFVITMDDECARGISAKMTGVNKIEKLDESSRSALCELANMTVANSTVRLEQAGYSCNISIPSLVTGAQMIIACPEKANILTIPLKLSHGDVQVNLSISETGGLEQYAKRIANGKVTYS